MRYKKIIFIALLSINISATKIPNYEAEYYFKSEDISIKGIREFKNIDDGFKMRFMAERIIASMDITSEFKIYDNKIKSEIYDVKIKPKFLNKDQLINFDYINNLIISNGENDWETNFLESSLILDPLNSQIMIRMLIKDGLDNFDLNLIDLKNGSYKLYSFKVIGKETCALNDEIFTCTILRRSDEDSDRSVTYYLAEELDYMFIKIIDIRDDKTSSLELIKVLSFG
tara:strand:- start:716 stop:1399 length:684 start_codon:yes stop_codon:yes gene_type:complete